MAINLLNIQPHKVSRDLSGFQVYIFGAGGTGKTTLASQLDRALLLAAEKGYNAIPGVMAQDITSWSEMKQVVRELKKPEVKDTFKSICIDTIDLMAEFKTLVGQIQKNVTKEEFKNKWVPKITEVTEKYLGVGKKVNDCTAMQSEQLVLIVDDLKAIVGEGL